MARERGEEIMSLTLLTLTRDCSWVPTRTLPMALACLTPKEKSELDYVHMRKILTIESF